MNGTHQSPLDLPLFKYRFSLLIIFVLASAFWAFQASQIKLDASFSKNVPLNHAYMETYLKHQKNFGGANNILISVCDKYGNIFNKTFFTTLKSAHDKLFFIPGIDRTQVKSLYSPTSRYVEIVEDGFVGGLVIPADFNANRQGLYKVKQNIIKAGLVGNMVSGDHSCSMISALLLDVSPDTGEAVDSLYIAEQLEAQLRSPLQSADISIHIIGFAKMMGDVAQGAKSVATFFALAICITAFFVFLFCRSFWLTLLPITCSLIAVVWQIGVLSTLGFGLDPMSVLIPFLVFAIAVSHGVQMINAIKKNLKKGFAGQQAVQVSFQKLMIPAIIALLSDTIGFFTLLTIDIGIIQELAITASLGVAMIILTNVFLLPLLLSYVPFKAKVVEGQPAQELELNQNISRKAKLKAIKTEKAALIWRMLAECAKKGPATLILSVAVGLFILAYYHASQMKIGDLDMGVAALHESARYNQDTFLITDKYEISVDYLSIVIESEKNACVNPSLMRKIDEFQWEMENLLEVESTKSLASVAKVIHGGYNEGNLKWQVLPSNQKSLVQAVARVPSSSGLLNADCSVMPIILFLSDHKSETINNVITKAKSLILQYDDYGLSFKLASGPVGVIAATNEAVESAQRPMMLYVYGAVIILCLVSFRNVRATIAVIAPLYLVSTLTQALMTLLNIGLTVSTLPVIALGVGIGVDYGIYILSSMNVSLKEGSSVVNAYFNALQERGSAVIFTAATLAIGVSTWCFSALKFQADMGLLLTFMFVVNMLGAIIVLPAIAAFLWPKKPQ